MIALAVEMSVIEGGVALWKDGAMHRVRSPAGSRGAGARALEAIRSAVQAAGCELSEVELFVAGRGPGNYSGIRTALTVAQSLALPWNREVIAVDSGSALAEGLFEETDAASVAVVGDARRGQVWAGVFERSDPFRKVRDGWKLYESSEFPSTTLAERIATSDGERLDVLFPDVRKKESSRWLPGNCYPDAGRLLRLARRRREGGCEPDPLTPLYLHPAARPGSCAH